MRLCYDQVRRALLRAKPGLPRSRRVARARQYGSWRFGARCCVPNPDCLGRVVWLERGSTAVGGGIKPEMRRDFCALHGLFI
ncbi:hypothetical protein NDU88_005791 [Pleurodeles waltl]|uniref:Uncharacterized protein n=1 Tax=Pleurodeles waltl TaxID=8319 RepID=A0AAV7SMS4_PLEWA|nr:hypothetical protein NDU88_005791 [Pleurodeles waltl]